MNCLWKQKRCPCCGQIITAREYIKQSEVYGEYAVPDRTFDVKCPSCKNVVMTNKIIERLHGITILSSILMFGFISILFFSKEQTILASIPGVIIVLLIYQYAPYTLLKMRCYSDEDLVNEKVKFISIFPFFFVIFVLFGIGVYLVLYLK